MARIYFYKLTADNGGAPCVQAGLLSLAICKPMIRSKVEVGDLIFGFAANSLHRDNRLIYIARVTAKACNGEYFTAEKFARREGALHHGPDDVAHDLGEAPDYAKAIVLLSNDFRYFGVNGSAQYKDQYLLIKNAVEHLGRGHRVRLDEPLRIELLALSEQVWNETRQMVAGEQTSKPRRGACHRGRSCGVIE